MTTTTLPYRKILVATDFSPAADAALDQAIWLARASGATVTLAHVLPDLRHAMHTATIDAKLDLLYAEGARFHQEVLGSSEQQLRRMVDRAAGTDVEITCKTLMGEPYVELCRVVQQAQHDLVIAGTRGVKGWRTFLIGSTARRLIHHCPAPVWVVKPEHAGRPKSVLAATDFSTVSRAAVLAGLEIAEHASASFHLLHVIDSMDVPENIIAAIPAGSTLRHEINEVAKRRFDEFLSLLNSKRDIHRHLSWGTPWQEINRLTNELSIDLVTIATVGRSGIPGLLLGNTAEKVLGGCDCSILTLKPHDFKSSIPMCESSFGPLK